MASSDESRGSSAGILRAFRRLAVIRAVRPDRIASCAQHFIDVAMGAPFAAVTDTDFQALVVKVRADPESSVRTACFHFPLFG